MKKCQFLADAAPHVHSNSPPAMPCSNRHAPHSANLRFNGITRPIYKRSKVVPFSARLFAATKAPFDQHNIEFWFFLDSAICASLGMEPPTDTLVHDPPKKLPCHLTMLIDYCYCYYYYYFYYLRATSTTYVPTPIFYSPERPPLPQNQQLESRPHLHTRVQLRKPCFFTSPPPPAFLLALSFR